VVKNLTRFAEGIRAGPCSCGERNKIVVLGVLATRAETGYGYIELAREVERRQGIAGAAVKRFTEKA